MGRFSAISSSSVVSEELEIEKLVGQDGKPDHHDAFTDLLEDTKDSLKAQEKKEEAETSEEAPAEGATEGSESTSDAAGEGTEAGERVTGDGEEESEEDSEENASDNAEESDKGKDADKKDEKSDDEKLVDEIDESQPDDKKDEKVTTESMREVFALEMAAVLDYERLALEDFGETASNVGSHLWSATKAGGSILASVGTFLGTKVAPAVGSALYRGIAYGFSRLSHGFMLGLTVLSKYLERRRLSFANLKTKIGKAQEAVRLLQSGQAVPLDNLPAFENQKTIRQIAIQDSVDLEKNLEVAHRFVADSIDGLGHAIKQDVVAIQQLIDYSSVTSEVNVSKLLKISVPLKGVRAGSVEDFVPSNPHIVSYVGTSILPGNTVLILSLPSENPNKNQGEWVLAYRDSEIFLGVDRSKVRVIESIPLMTLGDLAKLLGSLEALCDLSMKHQKFYEDIRNTKLSQKNVYKKYFESLTSRNRKVSIKESLIDLVTLRNNFIDKVYLPAAMDIHDYSVRVITAYLTYVEKNVRLLTP